MKQGTRALRILGQRIRYHRRQLGWSQEEFALEVDLARSYIGGVERGERNLSFINLAKIAGTLKITIAELCQDVPTIKA